MKIVQTIGFNAPTGWPTPFYYRRDRDGIHIKSAIGQPLEHTVTHDEWDAILDMIANSSTSYFGVTGNQNSTFQGPKLYGLISGKLKKYATNDRLLAYISAILVHEGTLHAFHGQLEGDLEARVYLKRSSEKP
jgi:hypothetical protein